MIRRTPSFSPPQAWGRTALWMQQCGRPDFDLAERMTGHALRESGLQPLLPSLGGNVRARIVYVLTWKALRLSNPASGVDWTGARKVLAAQPLMGWTATVDLDTLDERLELDGGLAALDAGSQDGVSVMEAYCSALVWLEGTAAA